MRLPRFTVRWLMVAVAIVGISLGWEGIRRRRAEYRSRWEYHSRWDREHRAEFIAGLFMMHRGFPLVFPASAARFRYHSEMAKKYARAARYPWLPVKPDPPEPE